MFCFNYSPIHSVSQQIFIELIDARNTIVVSGNIEMNKNNKKDK